MHVARMQGPSLIDTDKQDPAQHHRYSLRSRVANNITQLPEKKILHIRNKVIEPGTGNILEYRHLVKGMENTLFCKRTRVRNNFKSEHLLLQ